jgi:drug/metabolite transporter (DMT)-like permease
MADLSGEFLRKLILIVLTVAAFAANNVLCRKALAGTAMGPANFALVRMLSGALTLYMLTKLSSSSARVTGTWPAALALLAYLFCFSFAYVTLAAGTGALLLFGTVQVTMILGGLVSGERLSFVQWSGLIVALAGFTALMAPGTTAPKPGGAVLMILAGIAWGAYSLLGRSSKQAALGATAGNFLRASPCTLLIYGILTLSAHSYWDRAGVIYALAAGALASGIGYAVWYAVLPTLRSTTAASLQLSVPVITTLGGVVLIGEHLSMRLIFASAAVLGGIALVVAPGSRRA